MGELPTASGRVAIVAARFNQHIVERLLEGARAVLSEHDIAEADRPVTWVPGAYELPQAAEMLAGSGRFDAIIALGAVVRGGTPHFEYVSGPCAEGLMQVALTHGLPVAFGVLTCDDEAQALARAGGAEGNKGADAALTALQMIHAMQVAGGAGS